jgi:hypothetical protein
MLPRVRNVLNDKPKEFESFIEAYLACLALADLTVRTPIFSFPASFPVSADVESLSQHIGFTLYDLGFEGATQPLTHWNQLVVGNVVITIGLFLVRMMWFAGIARSSHRSPVGRQKKLH